jgi:ABC-2 type transport system permease protein
MTAPPTLRLAIHQARYELPAVLRDRQARFTTLVLPPALLVLFVGGLHHGPVGPQRVPAATWFVPGLCALAVFGACFGNVVVSVTGQRESGVLKRRRATPVPAQVLIVGRALAAMAVALTAVGAVCLVGAVAYGVAPRATAAPELLAAAVVGSVTFALLAYAVTTALHSADAAQPVVQAIALPLYVASGVLVPSPDLPAWLRDVGGAFPLARLADALHRGFAPGDHGLAPAWLDLAVLLAWAAAGLAVAVRRFHWTPAAAGA